MKPGDYSTKDSAKSQARRRPPKRHPPKNTFGLHPILNLQRAAGNRAVEQLLESNRRLEKPQTSLTVSQTDDPFELESEHITEHKHGQQTGRIPEQLMPAQNMNGESSAEQNQNDTGIPIPVRRKMERALGADFSDVRVHQESSRASELGAIAFTQGHDIHFAPGTWTPATNQGQEILGHELAHVMQQRAGQVKTSAEVNGEKLNDEPKMEGEADALGRLAARSIERPRPTTTHRDALGRNLESGKNAPQLPVGAVCQLQTALSPWWPASGTKIRVNIDNHDFDFDGKSEVDGPLSHNGSYSVIVNQDKAFKMKLNVGSNKTENDDLDVTLSIKDGQATITGSVKGKALEGAVSTPVLGSGTKSSPYHLDFEDKDKKKHSIVWPIEIKGA